MIDFKIMHKKLLKIGIEKLKDFDELSKLVLFGSVLKNNYRKNSDIDLAFICSDFFKNDFLNFEGIPLGLREKIDNCFEKIQKENKIFFHIPIYWDYEFEKGIELYSGKKSPPDFLHETGLVVYNRYPN